MKCSFSAFFSVLVLVLGASGCAQVLGADEIRFEEPAAPCSVARDCSASDARAPYACLEGACVSLLGKISGEPNGHRVCNRVLGEENLRSTVPPFLFGVLSSSYEGAGSLVDLNYNVVLNQFTAEGGLDVGGTTRLPVAVVCEARASGALDEAAEHLTGDLGIRALLTALPAAELKRTFERVAREQERSVFMVGTSPPAPLVTELDDGGLLWHVLPPPSDLAVVYPRLLRRVQAYLKERASNAKDGALRLALSSSLRAEDVDMASSIDASLVLNGKNRQELDRASYRRYALEAETVDDGKSYVDALVDLFEFRPHVVVAVDDDVFITNILRVLESAWEQVKDGQERPFYVLSPAQARSATLESALLEFPTLAQRVVGVAPAVARDTELHAAYLSDLASRNTDLLQVDGGESYYDAAYFLLYAAAASGAPEPSGKELASGMQRLLDGAPFSMGEPQIPEVLGALRDPNASVALYGTLGAPDFDRSTGARRHGEGSVWCVTLEGDEDVMFHYDALSLDASNDGLVGELECIPGF